MSAKDRHFVEGLDLQGNLLDKRDEVESLIHLLLNGRSPAIGSATDNLLDHIEGLDPIKRIFVPVLDEVGRRYEAGDIFLPQLIACAEAAQAGFEVIETRTGADSSLPHAQGPIIVATVKGDIHDIGKNIVAMLLANYGFEVIDLGFDVAPEEIVEKAQALHVKLIGLSALMTTTVTAMEETIRLVHERIPDAKVIVGGAVLTSEYAQKIGADFYSKDAAETVRIAQRFFEDK